MFFNQKFKPLKMAKRNEFFFSTIGIMNFFVHLVYFNFQLIFLTFVVIINFQSNSFNLFRKHDYEINT